MSNTPLASKPSAPPRGLYFRGLWPSSPSQVTVPDDFDGVKCCSSTAAIASSLRRLKKSEARRFAAISALRKVGEYDRHSWGSWSSPLWIKFEERGYHRILKPGLALFLWSVLWTVLAEIFGDHDDRIGIKPTSVFEDAELLSNAYSLVMVTLSLMLVFRLNRAAARWYEARHLAGILVLQCRLLASAAVACYPLVLRDGDLESIISCAVAFPAAFMETLVHPLEASREQLVIDDILNNLNAPTTKETGAGKRHALFLERIHGLFDPGTPQLSILAVADHPAMAVLDIARNAISRAVVTKPDSPQIAEHMQIMIRNIEVLGSTIGGSERINNTPLPVVYVAHLRVFLLLVLATIPIVSWSEWRWATPFLTLLIVLSLLGMESSALECERPFKRVPCMNHVNIEGLAKAVSKNVSQIIWASAVERGAIKLNVNGKKILDKDLASSPTDETMGDEPKSQESEVFDTVLNPVSNSPKCSTSTFSTV